MRRALSARSAVHATVGGSIFVYDARALGGEAEGWLGEGPAAAAGVPAAVRGRLYRGPRGRLGLLPDPQAPPVSGRLVEVTPAQLPVMDFLFSGAGGPFARRPVEVIVNLRLARATSWVLTDLTGWKPVKQERT